MAKASTTVYAKHADLPDTDIRHLPLSLCESTNTLIPDNVIGAQLINGIWAIWLGKKSEAKNYLLEGGCTLTIGHHPVLLYGEYPIIVRRPPTEKVFFKAVPFHVSDDDLLEYMYSNPDIKILTKRIIPARLRNHKRELTPYLSGDRFLYIIGDFRRVLPPYMSINNHKLRVMHQSQDLACSRCQYLGHTTNNTEACDALCDDQDNIITIRSPKDVLCNYYPCEVKVYGQTFRSSEHAFQWKLCSHVDRDDLAQDVLDAHTPEQAKRNSFTDTISSKGIMA